MHPWHDVELGDNFPETAPAVIEIPRNSKSKYAIDRKTGLLRLKHVLFTAAHYPMNYGIVPQTIGLDGDPLDILVINQEPLVPLSIVEVRPLGGMLIKSNRKGPDYKIIAVDVNDPECAEIRSIKEVSPHLLDELRQFFLSYKSLEKEKVEIIDEFGRKTALQTLEKSHEKYCEKLIVEAA